MAKKKAKKTRAKSRSPKMRRRRSVRAKSKQRSKPKQKASVKAGGSASTINVWQDDPASKLPIISQPVPNLSQKPLAFRFKGPSVPAGAYEPGTAQFRYWTAAEALRRGADFWAPLLKVSQWQPGPVLAVGLDEGVDFNAYYDRTELAFFHGKSNGEVVYSGESPDVVCHEMGHACLDAHRPALWDAPYIEVGSFHEAFGDMSAILSALQLSTVRTAALSGLKQNKSSVLSRLAEQLGLAIGHLSPQAVMPGCLRDAANDFKYVDPQSLPNSAPANQLCAEVHSFSRVFTGAFYDILCGMLKVRSSRPTEKDVAAVAGDCAILLLKATTAAPVVPNYYAQVASEMIDIDTAQFGGRYHSVLADAFVSREILPAAAVQASLVHESRPRRKGRTRGAKSIATHAAPGRTFKPAMSAIFGASQRPAVETRIERVALSAKDSGLAQEVVVHAPVEQKQFVSVAGAMASRSTMRSGHIEDATRRFVRMLVENDRIETPAKSAETRGKSAVARAATGEQASLRFPIAGHYGKTHTLIAKNNELVLVRQRFLCGCSRQ